MGESGESAKATSSLLPFSVGVVAAIERTRRRSRLDPFLPRLVFHRERRRGGAQKEIQIELRIAKLENGERIRGRERNPGKKKPPCIECRSQGEY